MSGFQAMGTAIKDKATNRLIGQLWYVKDEGWYAARYDDVLGGHAGHVGPFEDRRAALEEVGLLPKEEDDV